MAVLQNTYTSRHAGLVLGQVVTTELHNIVSRLLDDATPLGFGRAVFTGTGDKGVTATPSARFNGVTVRSETTEAATDAYAQRETMSVMKMGIIGVTASVAVVRDDQAYLTPAGLWTNVPTGNQIVAGAKFEESATIGAIVPLSVK